MQRRERGEVELERELTLDLRALLGEDPVPLVDRDDERPAALERESQHARVLLGDGVVRIEHQDHDVRLVDGLERLRDAHALDRILHPGAPPQPRGVDQQERPPIALEGHQDAVARGAGLLARDHPLLPEQPIDERGLAHVRSADDCDADGARVGLRHLLRLEAREHVLHELLAPLTVAGGDGERLAESERMEVRGHHVGVEPLGLVEDERDRLSGAAQLARHELILRREPGARVGEQQQPIGLGDRTLGLGAHLRLDAARVLDEPAGVDDDAGNRTHPAEAVLPVARESGHVRHDGVARSGEHVEERRLADVRPADEGDHGQHGRGGRTRVRPLGSTGFPRGSERASPAPSCGPSPARERAASREMR